MHPGHVGVHPEAAVSTQWSSPDTDNLSLTEGRDKALQQVRLKCVLHCRWHSKQHSHLI